MRFTRLLSGIALVTLTCSSVAVAQPSFSNADLEGRYAFATEFGGGTAIDATGVFTADGDGNIINGMRNVDYLLLGTLVPQTFEGTYTVSPDGTGIANLVSPDPYPGLPATTGEVRWSFVLVSPEKFRFTAAPGPLLSTGVTFKGVAERQGESNAVVLVRLQELEAKLCETIRLLNTPQGLRSSACCDEPLDFPNGKDAPTCGPTQPTPLLIPIREEGVPRSRLLGRR